MSCFPGHCGIKAAVGSAKNCETVFDSPTAALGWCLEMRGCLADIDILPAALSWSQVLNREDALVMQILLRRGNSSGSAQCARDRIADRDKEKAERRGVNAYETGNRKDVCTG